MPDDFIALQRAIIDEDMRTMPPELINEILADMKPDEANVFLGRLGHIRARDIYDRGGDPNGEAA